MNNQETILKCLEDASEEISNVLILLRQENKTNQFDYVTSPKLSNLFDNVSNLVNKINKIIYQK